MYSIFPQYGIFDAMKTCVTGKKSFPSMEVAEDVLIETHTRFEFVPDHGPIGVYKCDDCGYYHLTSQGTMNERLRKALQDGTIARQKEANRWEDKFRKR